MVTLLLRFHLLLQAAVVTAWLMGLKVVSQAYSSSELVRLLASRKCEGRRFAKTSLVNVCVIVAVPIQSYLHISVTSLVCSRIVILVRDVCYITCSWDHLTTCTNCIISESF